MEGNSNFTTQGVNGTDTAITYSTGNGKYTQGGGFATASSSSIDFGNNLGISNGHPISIGFWAQPTGTGDKDIVIKSDVDSSTTNYTSGIYLTKWSFGYHPALQDNVWSANVVADTTQFTHVAFTYTLGTGSTMKGYINGTDITSGGSWVLGAGNDTAATGLNSLYFSSPSAAKLYLGSKYDGKLDDICIFNRILTASEVLSLYSNTLPTHNLSTVGAGT